MLRALVTVAAAMVPLIVPLPGGGSRSLAPPARPVATAPSSIYLPVADADEPEAPAPKRVRAREFPRFLKPLAEEGIPRRQLGTRELLLTFDDGPDLQGTTLVLDELDRRGLKGIFFVAGHRMMGMRREDHHRQDLVRKLAAHGHLVANHTVNHLNLCRVPDAMVDEIDANSEVITYATGVRPLLFRSPYGARCRRLDQALRERDLIQVGWNIDPQEWKGGQGDAIFDYVTRKLRRMDGPGILLLHDTKPEAVGALPRILDWIDEENRRVARDGGRPIRIVDYSVLLPEREISPTGLEPVARALVGNLTVLPGAARLLR